MKVSERDFPGTLFGFPEPTTIFSMIECAKRIYEFGPFQADPLKRRLVRDGAVIPLTPKAFETLLVLIERRGEVVEKEDLIDKIWPGLAVEENNLTQNISALRKALGERRGQPQYILTVSGIGYRFIAEVTEAEGAEGFSETSPGNVLRPNPGVPMAEIVSSRSASRTVFLSALVILVLLGSGLYLLLRHSKTVQATPANSPIRSMAVLPFKPLVADDSDNYLGIGMADALITKLSGTKQIAIRPTNSILKYANSDTNQIEAARALEVDAVLDGRVQRSSDRIRVTVQLLRAADGSALWAGKFDEKYTDIFTLEDRISEEVIEALLPALTGTERQRLAKHYTEDTEAYQAYIKGRYYWNKRDEDGLQKAISYFEDAILKDPKYALAYAGLADSYAALNVVEDQSPVDLMTKARSAALRAIELDDELAEAHASLGYVKHRFEWDWPGAEKEFKRAIELNDDYATAHQWYGWYLISENRFAEAEAQFKRATEIDPLSLYTNLTAGMPYFFTGDYDRAAAQFRKVIEMDPNFWLAHRWLGRAYEVQRKYDQAVNEFETVIRLHGGNKDQAPALACTYALAGKTPEARRILAELVKASKQRYVSPHSFAMIYATLGDKDQAFECLGKELKEHGDGMVFLRVESHFDGLRSDPRFADLIKQVGIPQ